jgi:hypothetical protein
VVGAGAEVPPDAALARVVVWEKERVPPGFAGRGGVFAGGRFHAVASEAAEAAPRRGAA